MVMFPLHEFCASGPDMQPNAPSIEANSRPWRTDQSNEHAALIHFGGQGSDYLDQLTHLVTSFQTVRNLVGQAQAIFEQIDVTKHTRIEPLLWATEPASRPSRSALLHACVSYPLVFLTQLATYMAFLESMEVTHDELLPRIRGGTGHSQGVVAAVLVATATTHSDLEDLGLQFMQLMYHHGCRAQAAFDSVEEGHRANKVGNVVPTPMLLIRGWTESTLSSFVFDFNDHTMNYHAPVQISLVNDATSIAVTGHPMALQRLHAALEGKVHSHHPIDSFRLEFLPVSCPFHNEMLSDAQSAIEADATRLGLVIPGNALHFPVIGTTSDATDLKTYRSRDIIPDLIRMQLSETIDWPAVSVTLQSKIGKEKCNVFDFGPGRSTPLVLYPRRPSIQVSDWLHRTKAERAPMSPREAQVAAIWAALLTVDEADIGRKTSFFALGGDSVIAFQAVAACRAIDVNLTVTQFLRDPTVKGVVKAANSTQSTDKVVWPEAHVAPSSSDKANDDFTVYPTTPIQAGMVTATLSNASAYVLQVTLRLSGAFNQETLVSAFRSLVAANELLQTTFAATDCGIVQLIPTARKPVAAVISHVSDVALPELLESDFARGFTLNDSSFVRLAVTSPSIIDGSESYGVMTIHHALIDGWSMNALLSDLLDIMDGQILSIT
ncbi:hypothetical protein H310_13902 [Aphanomyces invadans]|uniref:Carrier domain-containing protein n=1 Tax=Aphanomyces invadans TaxID=157072 RepID=A0A024TD45_9STRA|nr:hypothetical protein H310_13902 [Aphanomyces invadans]ETV91506.1 hypothetical protein H310_13902 [Aphanomyces invadans]|eukprot:XP_008879774.1 hypothetical protein H310_13902 [Aphanomyces invadans]